MSTDFLTLFGHYLKGFLRASKCNLDCGNHASIYGDMAE